MCTGRNQEGEREERRHRSPSVFVIREDDEIALDIGDNNIGDETENICKGLTRSGELSELIGQKKPDVDEVLKRKKLNTRRGTQIITTGAMTLLVLAATLVTASFILSPIIEKMFG